MTEATILDALEKMEKAVEHVQVQFTTVRTGRATPALVERLLVEYYGSTVPLLQLAGFQVPEARQLLNFPALTEERRKEYVKVVKHMAEDGRVSVRSIRRDARKHLEAAEKASEISADELERAEKEMEKITHDHVELIDKALGRKEQELLEV